MHRAYKIRGFTLIELSIVLIVISLIIGAVFVGQDMIQASAIKGQISQINRYQAAVNAFTQKYGALPGDINATMAQQYGFAARGSYRGEGDGNGIIEGIWQNNSTGSCWCPGAGETALFWEDLSVAGLMDGNFNTASATVPPSGNITGAGLANYVPPAKIGKGNYVYVFGSYGGLSASGKRTFSSLNYFGIEAFSVIGPHGINSTNNLTVREAYTLDSKVDDGSPYTGWVQSYELSSSLIILDIPNINLGNASAPSATTCADNNNTTNGNWEYSMSFNAGQNQNCSLVFGFQ